MKPYIQEIDPPSLSHSLSTLHQYHRSNVAISGVSVTLSHVESALEDLHSSHSDAIGAPKVRELLTSTLIAFILWTVAYAEREMPVTPH